MTIIIEAICYTPGSAWIMYHPTQIPKQQEDEISMGVEIKIHSVVHYEDVYGFSSRSNESDFMPFFILL